MSIDPLGVWQGTFYTDGLWYVPNLFDLNRNYVGNIGKGGPPETDDVSLETLWQGDYQTFYYSLVVSPFYGDLVGVEEDSIPVSGFINTEGFIKLSLYNDARPEPPDVQQSMLDWTFNSFIRTEGGFHIMSGNWAKTSWSEGLLSYTRGTLNVRRDISVKERAHTIITAPRRNR